MRCSWVTIAVAAAIAAGSAPARAEGVALGVFVGEPLGLDVLTGLSGDGALDFVIGVSSWRGAGREISYGHLTYLHRLTAARGRHVSLPLRLGLGGALRGVLESDVKVAARVPLEVGLQFNGTPLELYGEIAFVLQLIDRVDTDVNGGVGIRLFL